MTKKDVWLILSVIALALLLALTLAAILEEKKSTSALQEAERIEAIDNLISKGAEKAAEESIGDLAAKDLSAASFLRLIKRAWQISRRNDSYEVYNRVTAAAVAAYPARGDLNALRIYGLLRSGQTSEAAELLSDSEIDTDDWAKLTAEAGLYTHDSAKPDGYALSRQSDPNDFFDMYEQTGSYGFFLDGLLLLLEQGRVNSAYAAVIEEDLQQELPPAFMFQLSYDAEHWQAAEDILSKHPQMFSRTEFLFISADMHMFRREYKRAAELYSTILESPLELPAHHKSQALLNLLYTYEKTEQKIPDEINELIRQTSAEDPNDSALLFAGYFLANNEPSRAQEILDISAGSDERSILRQVLREETGATVNPERYKSLLWRLVYRTEDENYAQYLAWFLIGIEDIEGLQSVIQHSHLTFGEQGWIHFYRGILYMYARKYEDAVEEFDAGYNQNEQWEYLYNAALSYAAAENPNAALDELKAAEAIVDSRSEPRATIMAQQVELLIRSGRYTEAGKLLSILEDRFPGKMEAGLLRSLLEARSSD